MTTLDSVSNNSSFDALPEELQLRIAQESSEFNLTAVSRSWQRIGEDQTTDLSRIKRLTRVLHPRPQIIKGSFLSPLNQFVKSCKQATKISSCEVQEEKRVHLEDILEPTEQEIIQTLGSHLIPLSNGEYLEIGENNTCRHLHLQNKTLFVTKLAFTIEASSERIVSVLRENNLIVVTTQTHVLSYKLPLLVRNESNQLIKMKWEEPVYHLRLSVDPEDPTCITSVERKNRERIYMRSFAQCRLLASGKKWITLYKSGSPDTTYFFLNIDNGELYSYKNKASTLFIKDNIALFYGNNPKIVLIEEERAISLTPAAIDALKEFGIVTDVQCNISNERGLFEIQGSQRDKSICVQFTGYPLKTLTMPAESWISSVCRWFNIFPRT